MLPADLDFYVEDRDNNNHFIYFLALLKQI